MNKIILISILLLIPILSFSKSINLIGNKHIKNKTLVKILNSGDMINLNEIDKKIKKTLSLKLYSVGIVKSIYETEMIFSHEYYLAVSEWDEWPEQTVYYLGEFGKIINIKWLEENEIDKAKLKLTIVNYPSWVLQADQKLKKEEKNIIISITVKSLKILKGK